MVFVLSMPLAVDAEVCPRVCGALQPLADALMNFERNLNFVAFREAC